MPGEKVSAVMFCKQFLAYAVHMIGPIILSINIQVGLNMHLYNDIGDASSSHWGSTSSLSLCADLLYIFYWIIFEKYKFLFRLKFQLS